MWTHRLPNGEYVTLTPEHERVSILGHLRFLSVTPPPDYERISYTPYELMTPETAKPGMVLLLRKNIIKQWSVYEYAELILGDKHGDYWQAVTTVPCRYHELLTDTLKLNTAPMDSMSVHLDNAFLLPEKWLDKFYYTEFFVLPDDREVLRQKLQEKLDEVGGWQSLLRRQLAVTEVDVDRSSELYTPKEYLQDSIIYWNQLRRKFNIKS